jgi:hypothetical protein
MEAYHMIIKLPGVQAFANEGPEQSPIDVREAFMIWDILASKHFMMQQLQIWDTVANDATVKRIIKKSRHDIEENIGILAAQLEKHVIPAPDKSRAFANDRGMGTGELISDKTIVMSMLFYQQEHVENMLTGIHRSLTNDGLRKLFTRILKKTVNLLDELILQVEKKGWHSVPPLYKPLPPGNVLPIGCAEAANLWDHIIVRYDNLHVTEVMSNLVHDKDFKIVFDMGIELLVKQIGMLENKCKKYGIALPDRPNDVAMPKELQLNFSDKYFYRELLSGMHGAALIHAKSFKQSTSNHDVRKIFKELLLTEVEQFGMFVKFGKMKEWIYPAPRFNP